MMMLVGPFFGLLLVIRCCLWLLDFVLGRIMQLYCLHTAAAKAQSRALGSIGACNRQPRVYDELIVKCINERS